MYNRKIQFDFIHSKQTYLFSFYIRCSIVLENVKKLTHQNALISVLIIWWKMKFPHLVETFLLRFIDKKICSHYICPHMELWYWQCYFLQSDRSHTLWSGGHVLLMLTAKSILILFLCLVFGFFCSFLPLNSRFFTKWKSFCCVFLFFSHIFFHNFTGFMIHIHLDMTAASLLYDFMTICCSPINQSEFSNSVGVKPRALVFKGL